MLPGRAEQASDQYVVIANFVIAILIASLLGFVIIDVLARSLARDDAKAAKRDTRV